ncbi:hypothetical protein [Longirhabdus pacifica]|uniref:hypothetical protein n=1 Tax=Longirhabdus pacifica TaxID=2305227 RepID=UPI001F0B9BE0|nr:hypothetical protein [Longirhabdus pacifica]
MVVKLFFKDNFFNAGETEILNESAELIGMLDLKSAFGSSLEICDSKRNLICSGSFPFFSSKWKVIDSHDNQLGLLRARLSMFSKKFEYETEDSSLYEIKSPAFSKSYEVFKNDGTCIAQFEKVNGWLQSDAYCLDNHSEHIDDYELIAVIMGVNAIQKRQNNSS